MAKAESGLRQRIKQALEADGWSVITQHGSAYSPNVLDLTIVLAALEVKTESGAPTVGQKNTIQRLRSRGIPAGIVRSVEEARQGMRLVKQGRCPTMSIDLSFLNNLLAGDDEPEAPTTTNLLGMEGEFREYDVTPAAPEPEPVPASPLQSFASMLGATAAMPGMSDGQTETPITVSQSAYGGQIQSSAKPTPTIPESWLPVAPEQQPEMPTGILELLLFRLNEAVDVLCGISDMLEGLTEGLNGTGTPSGPPPEAPQPAKRRPGRPKKIVEESVGSNDS